MKEKLIVSTSPHLHKKESVHKTMWMVVLSLIPAGVAGVYIFGMSAFWVILLCCVSAVAAEGLLQIISKRKLAILDASALLTGLLLAYNLPPKVPFWLPIVGSFVAIFVGKFIFGGLGQNIFNPALVGRAFLMASWPKYMTAFTRPVSAGATHDAVTAATPLALVKEGGIIENLSMLDLFLGKRGGCIGEVCIAALLLGAIFLLVRGYISWHIPVSYIGTTALLTFLFAPRVIFEGGGYVLFYILSGGLILGAFFMATDYVTSPLYYKGQIVFGIGCGLLTVIIRHWGGYPEGVSYAILIMNAFVPLIERHIRPRIYGALKR